jgi:hypothetical protein
MALSAQDDRQSRNVGIAQYFTPRRRSFHEAVEPRMLSGRAESLPLPLQDSEWARLMGACSSKQRL